MLGKEGRRGFRPEGRAPVAARHGGEDGNDRRGPGGSGGCVARVAVSGERWAERERRERARARLGRRTRVRWRGLKPMSGRYTGWDVRREG